MTTFDERERAFENKFQHDEDVNFRVHVRRAKLLAQWAAERMGLDRAEADAYALGLIDANLERNGHAAIVQRVCEDLSGRGLDISRHRVEREADTLLAEAKRQIMTE